MVTFWYRVDGEKKTVTMLALEFIDHLVRLIPDKNLKLIRYYGLYSRRTMGKLQKMLTPLSREKPRVLPRKEVVKCRRCGQPMELLGATRPNLSKEYDSE